MKWYVTAVAKYHNAHIWSMDYYILRFMFKNIDMHFDTHGYDNREAD